MRTLPFIIAITGFLVTPVGNQADAQVVGVSFSSGAWLQDGIIPGYVAPGGKVYVIAEIVDPTNALELAVTISGPEVDKWTITEHQLLGSDLDPDPNNYIISLGECTAPGSFPLVIVTFEFTYLASPRSPLDTLVCVEAPTHSEPQIPGFPSYQTCDGTATQLELYDWCSFDETPAGCAMINRSFLDWSCIGDPVESASWSSVKSLF